MEHIGFINFGKVVNWTQSMNSRYGANFGQWVRPVFSWRSSYGQNNGPELSKDLSIRSVRNNEQVTMSWGLPFDGLLTRTIARAPGHIAPQVPGTARPDSAAPPPPAPPRPALWRLLLSRLGNISTDAGFNWSSAYSRLTGTPGLAYMFGLSGDPETGGNGVQKSFGNSTDRSYDWKTSARTRLALAWAASITTQAEYGSGITNRNDLQQSRTTYRFPDMQVDYGNMANAIRLDRLFKNPRLRTSFSRSSTTEFTGVRQTGATSSSEWRPMLGLDGDFRNGAHLQFSVEHRVTARELFQLGHSTATDRNTDINFGVNRQYSQGQKVAFMGKTSTVKSTVNIGVSASYSRQTGETVQDFRPGALYPTKRDRLSINTTGSYGFSSNVTGDVNLGFVQNRDLVLTSVNKSVRVELAARFSF
jgi:hypothetical protein